MESERISEALDCFKQFMNGGQDELMQEVFKLIDIDNSGSINLEKLKIALKIMKNEGNSEEKAQLFFSEIHKKNDGNISQEELLSFAKDLRGY